MSWRTLYVEKRKEIKKGHDLLYNSVPPFLIFVPSAVLGLSMKEKRKGCGGQMDMKKHRKHELGKT